MSRVKNIEAKVDKYYRVKFLDGTILGYYIATKQEYPEIKDQEVVDMYLDNFGLKEDNWKRDAATQTLRRMKKLFLDVSDVHQD